MCVHVCVLREFSSRLVDCSERVDVCDTQYIQRASRMSRILADFLDNGRSVFRRQVFQVCRRVWRNARHFGK